MARICVTVVAILFALSLLGPTEAAEIEELDSGMVFGGLHVLTNGTNILIANSSLNDLPTITEDYTATWCGQCLVVEEALENVASTSNMQVYSIHRSINDPEDPLGSEAVDAQFRDRYDPYLPWKPPIVGFNGTYAISGNVPVGSSLEEDYREQAAKSLDLGPGYVTFAWTPTGANSGTVSWGIEQFTNSSFNVSLWVVETVGTFADGTNGKGDYPHIVREIIHLGLINSTGFSQGSKSISYADAYDGDDLELHLMFHEIVEEVDVEEEVDNTSEDEDEKSNSSTLLISLAVIILAAIGIASSLITKKDPTQENDELVPTQVATTEPTILNEWTDEKGHTWRKMSDGSGRWWNGTDWQEV